MLTLFPIKLYSTACCHLCDEAQALLSELAVLEQTIIIDIAEDDLLLAQYGLHIPVLQRSDDLSELRWPFNIRDLIAFLKV